MAKIKIHAGDFPQGSGSVTFGIITFPWQQGDGFCPKTMPIADFQSVEIATEEAVKRLGGTVGWGAAGAVLLGPVGLLAGLLMGGRGKDVTFVGITRDGRKMLATTDSKTYTKIAAACF
jgi:hypothetical protein